MKAIKFLFLGALLVTAASCSNDDEALAPNAGYTAVQQKALTILNGTWVSNEVKVSYEMGGSSVAMATLPSDSLVFLSQYPAPQSFYAYDYLQGKETESFVACGTCELYLAVKSKQVLIFTKPLLSQAGALIYGDVSQQGRRIRNISVDISGCLLSCKDTNLKQFTTSLLWFVCYNP